MKILFIALILTTTTSYAYIDPITGSFVIQWFIALVAGTAVAIKLYWSKMKAFFTKSNSKALDEIESGDTVDPKDDR